MLKLLARFARSLASLIFPHSRLWPKSKTPFTCRSELPKCCCLAWYNARYTAVIDCSGIRLCHVSFTAKLVEQKDCLFCVACKFSHCSPCSVLSFVQGPGVVLQIKLEIYNKAGEGWLCYSWTTVRSLWHFKGMWQKVIFIKIANCTFKSENHKI